MDDFTVFEFVVLHHLEDIVVNITEILYIRLNTPVVLKVVKQGVSKEEARLETMDAKGWS